jgi:hypothetical protein
MSALLRMLSATANSLRAGRHYYLRRTLYHCCRSGQYTIDRAKFLVFMFPIHGYVSPSLFRHAFHILSPFHLYPSIPASSECLENSYPDCYGMPYLRFPLRMWSPVSSQLSR